MKIRVAKNTGFCMGVRKAVLDIVDEINHSNQTIYVMGPLIHNPQTISILQSRGLITIDSISNIENKVVAIRTHGIPRDSLQTLKKNASRVINLTCPRVARVQGIVKKYSKDGYFTIIIGDDHHAEVESVKSYADSGVIVISNIDDVNKIPNASKYIVVAQTTFDEILFDKISNILKTNYSNILIFNTICDSTHKRQSDVTNAIKDGIDTLVVVGGKNSANTQRLASIGKSSNVKTFHIETEEELNDKDFSDSKYVLVTAGASTPGWIINNVLEKLYSISNTLTHPLISYGMRFLEVATRLNIISSVATFFITLLTETVLNIWSNYKLPSLSALFVFVMYAINNYFLKDTLKITNPFKFKLHKNNHAIILLSTLIAVTCSILLSITIHDYISLLVFYSIFLTGIIYSTSQFRNLIKNIFPSYFFKLYSIKSIPANIGWIVISIILPLAFSLSQNYVSENSISAYIAIFIFLSSLIFARNILLDLIGYGGDLIIGNTTLPIILGTTKIKCIFYIMLFFSAVSVVYLSGAVNLRYIFFLTTIIINLILFRKIFNLTYFISLKYEILCDVNFIIFIIICLYILSQ